MQPLENYIEGINSALSPEYAFRKFSEIMQSFGYDRTVYSLVTDHPSLNLPRQHGLVTNYPQTWMKYYINNNYIDVDPVIERISKHSAPFFWSDLQKSGISEEAALLMNEANEEGVSDGIGISLQSGPGEIVGVGLARTDTCKEIRKDYELLAAANLITVFFHETYRSMLKKPKHVKLSEREKEVLLWAAESKTDDEIAMILLISVNTVRFHWKNIFKKLEAYGRVYAITKAIRLQIITPVLVMSPYQSR